MNQLTVHIFFKLAAFLLITYIVFCTAFLIIFVGDLAFNHQPQTQGIIGQIALNFGSYPWGFLLSEFNVNSLKIPVSENSIRVLSLLAGLFNLIIASFLLRRIC